jgi:hypothetical protein
LKHHVGASRLAHETFAFRVGAFSVRAFRVRV